MNLSIAKKKKQRKKNFFFAFSPPICFDKYLVYPVMEANVFKSGQSDAVITMKGIKAES